MTLPVPVRLQDTTWSCGAACMQSVLAYHGVAADEAELCRVLGTGPKLGTPPQAIIGLAQRLGLSVEERHGASLDDLGHATASGVPVLCAVQMHGGGHWVIVCGTSAGSVCLMDPVKGNITVGAEAFDTAWHDTAGGQSYDHYALAIGKPVRESRLREVKDAAGHEHDASGRFGSTGGAVAAGKDSGAEKAARPDNDAAVKSAVSASKQWAQSLPRDEKDAVKSYTNDSSVNDRLRAGTATNRHDQKAIELLDSAIDKASLPEATTLIRGTGQALAVGDSMVEDGYTSATASEAIAQDFADRAGGSVIEMRLPAGFPAAHIAGLSPSYASEGEFLLPRGMTMKVTGEENGRYIVEPVDWYKPDADDDDDEDEPHKTKESRRPSPLHRLLEDQQLRPLEPTQALDFFRSLVPTLGLDPLRVLPDLRRTAFTLAVATETEILAAVQNAILGRLTSGDVGHGEDVVQEILDAAGLTSKNPRYAEMVFRTNAMDSYNQGLQDQITAEQETFPVWQYSNPGDNRSRPEHAARDGRYYPSSVPFTQVRGTDIADVAQCRCTAIPIDRWTWSELKAKGARIADGYPDVP